jgi:serine/threonine protein kinase
MEDYQLVTPMSRGCFGRFYHCRHQTTHVDYTVKKIRDEEDSITPPTLREISMMKSLKRCPHENILE